MRSPLRTPALGGAGAALLLLASALPAQTPGPNVNMVSGTSWPGGDPFLQRQNEPSVAVSTRNPMHLLAGANDYRTVDLPGRPDDSPTGDAWLGVFTSRDGGATWKSTLLPGYPQESPSSSPLHGYDAAADPTVRSGTNGLFYYSGIAFDRTNPVLLAKRGLPPRAHAAGADGASSAVFVARFIDNNNRENGEMADYLGTTVVARNQSPWDTFLDKPWLAVDIPRRNAGTCLVTRIVAGVTLTQELPAGNVYVAYTAFSGTGDDLRGRIFFARSTDCGGSWSPPVELSSGHRLNQGVTISLDPRTGTVYVAWRRFASPQPPSTPVQGAAVLLARSLDGGLSFTPPQVVASDVAPFDQTTFASRFRTNSYPALAIDRNGDVHVAWSRRGVGPGGDARVVHTQARYKSRDKAVFVDPTDDDGTEVPDPAEVPPIFPTPTPVADHAGRGHQLMPSMIHTNGRLQLAWLDLREDHTWAEYARATDGSWAETRVPTAERTNPSTTGNVFNQRVDDQDPATRRHTVDVWIAQAPVESTGAFTARRVSSYAAGTRPGGSKVEQLQFNAPNLPLFRLGTNAFAGDYVDLAAQPFEMKGTKKWKPSKKEATGGVAWVAFTDNRDVRGPSDGDWTHYTPPWSPALAPAGTFEPGTAPLPCDPQYAWRAGMRNQNVYIARVSQGLFVGAPGNAKPLGRIQRAFVVSAHNDTKVRKSFRLSIAAQPLGGSASFLQFSSLAELDVTVPPRSSISRSVFVQSSDPRATVQVDVLEIVDGRVVPVADGGLQDSVVLNPDILNPEIMNPEIMNPEIMNPEIMNAEVYNPEIMNPEIMNPEIMNPEIMNPEIMNPEIMNPEIMNPEIVNPEIMNPEIMNPEIMNPEIMNPEIMNPEIMNGALSDTTWTITNTGNTISSFNVELLLRGTAQVPEGFKTQLILHKTYLTPTSCACQLVERTQNVVVANIVDPRFVPASQYDGYDPTDGSAENATIWLAPEETARITLRVLDPDPTDNVTFDVVSDVAPIVTAGAVDTEDAAAGSTTPNSATTLASLFLQRPTDTPVGGLVEPPVSVLVQDDDGNPVAGASVTLQLLPGSGGATLHGNTGVTNATGVATFPALWLDRPGAGHRLVASATSGGSTILSQESAYFDVLPLVVTTTAEAGPGSLRRAIENANRNVGYADSISFAIPGPGPHLIALATALPAITDTLSIDARTQPGYAGEPMIRVDGNGLPLLTAGLYIRANGSSVRGLAVTRFPGHGIWVSNVSGVVLAANYVGTDGALALGNGNSGLFLSGGTGAVLESNTISGNSGAGIMLSGTHDNVVVGNRIGTDATGLVARPNGRGILMSNSYSNRIGGADAGQGNVISGNSSWGVEIDRQSHHNLVEGNIAGLDATGSIAIGNISGVWIAGHDNVLRNNVLSGNTQDGVQFFDGSENNVVTENRIGTNAAGTASLGNSMGIWMAAFNAAIANNLISKNVISGNTNVAIYLRNAHGTRIVGNLIGTDSSGSYVIPPGASNNSGISCTDDVHGTRIGGTTPEERNVISGHRWGIEIRGTAAATVITGNYIGTSADGSAVLFNRVGLYVSGTSGHTIGGTGAGEGNVISGNSWFGILLGDTATISIAGNLIGTNAAGTSALGNRDGVYLVGDVGSASNAVIQNVISGNSQNGLLISGSSSNAISGNLIGTNAAGNAELPNQYGITFTGTTCTLNVIDGNVVSGSTSNGIEMTGGAHHNTLRANLIGSDVTGTAGIPNAGDGLLIRGGAHTNTIGGTAAGDGNVFVANNAGIVLGDTYGNAIQGNWIGTNTALSPGLGSIVGIYLNEGTGGSLVGGPGPGEANVIAFNRVGVQVYSGAGHAIISNSFFGNEWTPLNLALGTNDSIPFPVITSAIDNGTTTTISGTASLASPTSGVTLYIQIYSNPTCEHSLYGEGKTLLGTVTGITDGAGVATFSGTFPSGLLGQVVTATTNTLLTAGGNTSQFSACRTVTGP